MFHEVKGTNITFDKNRTTATWNPVQTGGLIFTEKPVTTSEPVTLTLQGTGAVELGIIHTNPATFPGKVPDSANKLENYYFLNDVKIHKRTCTMSIKLDDKMQEVIASYGGGHYKQGIDMNLQYWLVADVKYGAVELKLENLGNQNIRHQFSECCGGNMKRLNDPSVATSQMKSPAALCFYSDPVTTGKQYVLHCTPKAFQGTIPGRYYVILRYTRQNPSEFRQQNEDKFDILKQTENIPNPRPEWYQIEKFEKDECSGNPVIVEFTGDSFLYKTASGKRSRQNCRINTDPGIWLVYELYGVAARLEVINVSNRRSDGNCIVESLSESGNMAVPSIPEEAEDDIEEIPIEREAEGLSGVPHSFRYPRPVRHPETVASCVNQIEDPVSLDKAIQKNFTKLRDTFIVNEFIDYMFENDMITRQEFEQLGDCCHQDRTKATKKVLMTLSARPVSKKFMLMALENTKQQFLISFFFPEEEKE